MFRSNEILSRLRAVQDTSLRQLAAVMDLLPGTLPAKGLNVIHHYPKGRRVYHHVAWDDVPEGHVLRRAFPGPEGLPVIGGRPSVVLGAWDGPPGEVTSYSLDDVSRLNSRG